MLKNHYKNFKKNEIRPETYTVSVFISNFKRRKFSTLWKNQFIDFSDNLMA